MKRCYLGLMIMIAATAAGFAQDRWDVAKTTIAGKSVSIEYGRPNLQGRNLADLMNQLPASRIWRAGSGPVTILSLGTDALIGGKKVPAGNYSLYMHCPKTGDYSLIINEELGNGLAKDKPLAKPSSDRSDRPYPSFMDYEAIAHKEVARIPLKKTTARKSQILIYEFEPSEKGAVLTIIWGDQAWSVDFQPAT